jgi:lysophospholipase L1-like esterase
LALGDSVTLGLGVSDKETFSVRLEQRLLQSLPARDVEVVNCGVSGYSTRQEAVLLERINSRLAPSLVLLGFYMNDVPDALADSAQPTLSPRGGGRGQGEGAEEPYAAEVSTRLLSSNLEPGTLRMHQAPSRINLLMRRSRAVYCASRTIGKLLNVGEWSNASFAMELDMLDGKQTPPLTDAWEIVEDQLRRVRAVAESANVPVGIVVLPCREQVMHDYPNAEYQTKIKQLGEQCGFFVIDPLERLCEHRSRIDELFVRYDRNHPSALGHDLIAQTIAEYFAEHPDLLGGER